MYYEVLEQLIRDRSSELMREAEAARLVSHSRQSRRLSVRRKLAVVLELRRERRASARVRAQA
jgi:hypothetical protein